MRGFSRLARWIPFAVVAALAVVLGFGLGLRKAPPRAAPPGPAGETGIRHDLPSVDPASATNLADVPRVEPLGDPQEPVAILGDPGLRHDAPLEAAALSPDGETLVSLDSAGALYGWNRSTGERLYRVKAPGPRIERAGLICTPDGTYAALFSRGRVPSTVKLVEMRSGREVRSFDRCCSPVFSPDGRVLAGSDGRSLRRWQVEGGLELPRIEDEESELLPVAFSPDGKVLAAGFTGQGGFALWDALSGRAIHRSTPESDFLPVTGLAFTPDGNGIAVGNTWGVRIWERERPGKALLSCAAYSGPPLGFSADGRWLVGTHHRRLLGIWDTRTAEQVGELFVRSDPGNFLHVSGKGDDLIRSVGSTIHLQSIADVVGMKALGSGRTMPASAVAFGPDGRAVTGGADGRIRIYDPWNGRELQSHPTLSGEVVALTKDCSRAVLKQGEAGITVWDLQRRLLLMKVEGLRGIVSQAIAADGEALALGTRAGTVALMDLSQGRELVRTSTPGTLDAVTAVAFSPDRRLIAWGTQSGAVVYADSMRGHEALRFQPRGSGITALAFSPDGREVATGGEKGEVFLWGLEAGVEPTGVVRLEHRITALAFSPDGRRLVCGTAGGELHLASTRGNAESFSYAKQSGPFTSIAFSRDGKQLVTGSAEAPARVWSLPRGK